MNSVVRFIVLGADPARVVRARGVLAAAIGLRPTLFFSAAAATLVFLPLVVHPIGRLREMPGPDEEPELVAEACPPPRHGGRMPEFPEMEAWRRQLNEPVSAFPIERAGPAHVATLKTFDPPLSVLEGRGLAGARRRAKRLLFPTTTASSSSSCT